MWSSRVTRKADHRLVDTGPYAWVRHSIYAGTILATLATATIFGTVLALAGATLMTISWYIKARLEEQFLCDQLGEDYDTYSRHVPMLLPFMRP
jgi:protein-S-isoprenylcysteine O-methyltransferase Ste14